MKTYCPDCYPTKRSSHWEPWVESVLYRFLAVLPLPKRRRMLPRRRAQLSPTHWLYSLLALVRVIRFRADCPQEEHYARSWLILAEAQRRGIAIEHMHILGRPSTEYRARFGARWFYFDIIPTRYLLDSLDDKVFVKRRLIKHGFPAPEGAVFWSRSRAARYARTLGFPLAIKPAHGTRSQHVTAPVDSADMLRAAIGCAARYGGRFIVERYISGELYRVTVIGGTHVFVAHRIAPHVIGDGAHTIRELIKKKNRDPRRGETDARHTTLHRIVPSEKTEALLAAQSMTLDSTPEIGRWIALYEKRSTGAGGDLNECTPDLHPETREMFRHAARRFGVDLVGFDFIAEDIARSYQHQRCGIIEANSLPFIDFHVAPTRGTPQPVAQHLWDGILADPRAELGRLTRTQSQSARLARTTLGFVVPPVRRILNALRIVDTDRQPFLIGHLRDTESPERVIAHLKIEGYEDTNLAWDDRGQLATLRKFVGDELQCHIRVFDDGEIRGHVEYAPETRPLAHMLEDHFMPLGESLVATLSAFLQRDHPPGET